MTEEIIILHGSRHVVWQCRSCGVFASCPEAVYLEHHREGGFHHCPNGHQWGWSKENCEREQLRRERDSLKQRMAEKDDEISRQKRLCAAAEAGAKRLQRRAKAAMCPCCHRSFVAMRRHLAAKHPEYLAGNVLKLAAP